MEGLYQISRQLADEAYGVHQQVFAAVRQAHIARYRVQRGEKPVFYIDVRTGDFVQ